jgi:hypothetical protein
MSSVNWWIRVIEADFLGNHFMVLDSGEDLRGRSRTGLYEVPRPMTGFTTIPLFSSST